MKKIKIILFFILMFLFVVTGCSFSEEMASTDQADVSATNNTTMLYAATDDLNRTLGNPGDEEIPEYDGERQVGVFYFLWLGATSAEGPYDVSKVQEADPNAAQDGVSWLLAGGGSTGQRHWWGESLFGYYRSTDQWVVERDVQMLTDAGVDYLALDYSNATKYPEQLDILLKMLDKYYSQGFDVPQITFITKADSGNIITYLYEEVYKKYPEYDHLWYRVDGKPLMIGATNSAYISKKARNYFTLKWAQWPKESYNVDALPWMDFNADGDDVQTVYEWSDGTAVMSVSVAQHCGTMAFSSSAFYGDTTNHTRSYHDGANDTSEDAVLYGYNFAEQFENAIEQNVDMVFLTGWNEWIATRQSTWTNLNGEYNEDPIILVDTADLNNSRDLQPMTGGYGDNYYIQMIDYIRKFKGCKTVNENLNTAAEKTETTINVKKSFDQWNVVPTYYLDYTDEIGDRDSKGFGDLVYQDTTGRNDIYKMKMTNDADNLYCYVETMTDIEGMKDDHCMSLFLATGNSDDTWCGYDYVVNRTAPSMGKMVIEKRTADGTWETCGKVSYKQSGNKIQLEIPLSLLGYEDNADISLEFKWADNYQGEDDIWSFYKNGDAAPYGRLNFVYEDLKDCLFARESRAEAEKRPSPDGLKIKKAHVLGDWQDDRIWDNGNEDGKIGPSRAYDGDVSTIWNPCSSENYEEEDTIVFELNGTYELESIVCTFTGSAQPYFDVSVSADGENYRDMASVSSGKDYQGKSCSILLTDATSVKYVKMEFTGSNNNSPWISFAEIEINDKE